MPLQNFVVVPQLGDATRRVTVSALLAIGKRTALVYALYMIVRPAMDMVIAPLWMVSVDASQGGQVLVVRFNAPE